MDMDGRTLNIKGAEVPMTPLEFDLLAALVRRPGQAMSRQELLETVWGYSDVSDSLVNVHVQRLARSLRILVPNRLSKRCAASDIKYP